MKKSWDIFHNPAEPVIYINLRLHGFSGMGVSPEVWEPVVREMKKHGK
jgi:hypothetical protein